MGSVSSLHSVEQGRPFIAGRCFDDTWGMTYAQINLLASRDLVYITDFSKDGRVYGGTVLARNWNEAERICRDERPWGEQVIGCLAEASPGIDRIGR